MMGVLADGKGIPCVRCGGSCSVGEAQCDLCDGNGTLDVSIEEAFGAEDEGQIGGELSYARMLVQLCLWVRERPPLPNEWLAQPFRFHLAFYFLQPHIFGGFEDRQSALRDSHG